jgi:O-antigen chain-terminating methyltransferase
MLQLETKSRLAEEQLEQISVMRQQLHDVQVRLDAECRRVAVAETMAVRAREEIQYLTHRSFWEALLFRSSGKPKRAVRRLLFHKSGKPRGIFKSLVLHPDGRPHKPFRMWMSSTEYQSLHAPVRLPDQ